MTVSTAPGRRSGLFSSIAATTGILSVTLGMLFSGGAAQAAPLAPAPTGATESSVSDSTSDTGVSATDTDGAIRNFSDGGTIAGDSGNAVTDLSGCPRLNFTDNRTDSAYYRAVRWMQCAGMTAGRADHSFGKNTDVTRAEMSAFLFGMEKPAGYQAPSSAVFADVKPGTSFFRPISWASAERIVSGFADGTFKKNSSLTRAHLAQMLYKMSGSTHQASGRFFTDMNSSSGFADAVSWLKAAGITSGYQDGSFKPSRSISRAEAASFLYEYARATGQKTNAPVGTNGPLTNAQWAAEAKRNIRAWCGTDYDLTAAPGIQNKAGFEYNTRNGAMVRSSLYEYMHLSTTVFEGTTQQVDPDHPAARFIQMHECAHLIQFRNYGWDGPATRQAMDRLYPNPATSKKNSFRAGYSYESGLEHMADCMADSMGGLRYGDSTIKYSAGYGGDCTASQKIWAKRLVAGERL
ncbi:S-layer homology domain-containing protein [Citricoccus sp. GCM10030269]|uniref:S-layer homology domain-containing protein n=1 Tax=Citricoccus sp. GCM10030269 TaxID=3273388 RepID=UPI0036174DFB